MYTDTSATRTTMGPRYFSFLGDSTSTQDLQSFERDETALMPDTHQKLLLLVDVWACDLVL
jgi:hypothetical protein